MKPGELRIISELMRAKDGLKFTQLKALTMLSQTAVSNYLATLQKAHIIMRDLNTKRYRIRRVFRDPQEFKSYERDILDVVSSAAEHAIGITEKRDRAAAKEVLRGYYLHNCSMIITKMLDFIQGGRVILLGPAGKFNIEDVDSYFSKLHDSIQNWLVPWVEMLAFGHLFNPDISDDVVFEVTQKYAEMAMDVSWVDNLEKE